MLQGFSYTWIKQMETVCFTEIRALENLQLGDLRRIAAFTSEIPVQPKEIILYQK
jgi:hypothetical protein